MAEHWGRASAALRTREVGSYHAMLASVATGQSIGVMPQSVLDILPSQPEVKTFPLGLADTLLIRRKDDRSTALQAFLDLLKAGAHPTPPARPHA
jgi:DNA-binding transcriptional LysR family regulator